MASELPAIAIKICSEREKSININSGQQAQEKRRPISMKVRRESTRQKRAAAKIRDKKKSPILHSLVFCHFGAVAAA